MTKETQKSAFWQAMGMAWELGYIIAIPLVLFALSGRFIDTKYDTSPWYLLAGIMVSIIISSIGLVWKFNKIIASINKDDKENKANDPTNNKNK